MKTKSSLSLTHLRKILLACIIFLSIFGNAQTTIVNYNFDVANITNYNKFWPRAVNGISSLLSSADTYNQSLHAGSGSFVGTVTGGSAFDANTASSPNRIVALNGSGSKYFNFKLSGSSLKAYATFKIYFQARRNGTGTANIDNVQYSVDGGAYTNFATPGATTTSWAQFLYSLPSIAPNSTLDIRINFTNSASGTVFAVDNFQVQAIGPSTSTVCIASNHPVAGNLFASTTDNMIAAYRMDAHITSITPTGITFATGGTYLSTDIANFKLWQNSYNSLYGATQIGSTILTASSGTNITFNTGFSTVPVNQSTYFFITADVLATASTGRTLNLTTTAFSNFTFSGSPTKIGNDPLTIGNTYTVATSENRYTQSSGSGNWDNGSSVNRWATTSGGSYTGKWIQTGIANLETSGETIQVDATNGAIVKQINVTASNFNIQSTLTQATIGITMTSPAIFNISGSNILRMSNSAGGNGNGNPLLTSYGFRKEGTGELMFSQPFSIYNSGVAGPIYINGGTVTIGDKSNTNNPNLYLYDNDFFINNGKYTIAASSSTFASTGFMRSMTVDGSGSNNAAIEIYNTAGTGASLYVEPTTDDRYPQLAMDLVPLTIKGTLSVGYGGTTNGVTNAFVFGNVNLTGNTIFKPLTNGSGNLAGSSGIITNIELSGEGGRSGLSATPALGSWGVTDNGYTLGVQGGGSSASDGGYVSINGGAGTSTGAWTVGNADGSEAGYLSINDVTGLTTGSITVNQNSQLDINVTGATVNIAKTPSITLNGSKTFSYYGAMALYNSTASSNNTLSSPIVVNTSDATVGIYNDAWTLAGAITGAGGFQLWANTSTHNLILTSASNTWTGGTKVLSGILNVSSGSSISTGSLTMGQLSNFDTRLNLNNATQTISSLTSSWTNTSGTQSQVVNLATNHILTINQSTNTSYGDGAVSTLTAIISGAGNLIKDGAGTLTLTGANTYTGLTQVKGGILRLSRLYAGTDVLPSTNNVDVIGGTLQVSTNQTLNNVTLSTGILQVDNGVTLTINGMFTLVNGSISLVGTGKIAYGPSGRITYAGSNAQTTAAAEIPTLNGPKGIVANNNTGLGVTLNANVSNLTGASVVNGWLDFNGKTMTGTGGTFTLNGLVGPYTFTGTTSTSSNVITNASSTGSLTMGMRVISSALPSGTYIIYIDPLVPNTVTVNNNGSSNSSGVTITAAGRGGLKVSLPEGIGNGTVNAHVQTTGTNVYNSGANYVFNNPTTGTTIYPAFPTVGTLTYSPAYDVTIQAGVTNKVILGTSQDIEISHDLTLTSGIFVSNNNLITWSNSGGTLTSPNVPYVSLSTGANASYIAIATNTGAELSLTLPYTGTKGFKIKNVGSGTDVYFPIGINFTSANRMMLNNTGTTSDFAVAMKTGDLLLTPGARVNRIWYVSSSAASGVKANMRLFFTKKDWSTWPSPEEEVESGFVYSDIHLIQKDYSENFINKSTGTDVSTVNFSSSSYDNTEIYGKYTIGVSPDPLGGTNGINSFTRFSLVNEYIILPVTLTNIKAYQQGNNILVGWTALNEINIDHYEIEKSLTGINFKQIGKTNALNNGTPQNMYTITDPNAAAGNNFYRIKIIGKDGATSYTAVVSVNISNGKVSVTIQPNPVQNKIANLQLNNLAAGKYQVSLYNSVGQKVYSKIIEHSGGSSAQQMNIPGFVKPGTYICRVVNETTNFSIGLVIE
ncbi:T9SS type A sorting domain-containing protein [Panacibacter ginsenosidivorans]|uniref:T9SS type A sorting domain-containing protein n=1 Tax=Panacibacter ginsenosidivorans TaxID=1813871 RepID=A0A5B8V495_9BACT|nr:autotransporter-associated beta strand repeat-containing protein [Panacibacter ginsenosidivorans]QEC66032.1 T9SS type A sorting domain-containing protein [Panacibacter ginsenosidivorans]